MFTYEANPLPSFSHDPLPPLNRFLKIPEKFYKLVAGTEPSTVTYRNFEPQQLTALTVWPSQHVSNYNLSVRIQSIGSGLSKISFFFPKRLQFYFQNILFSHYKQNVQNFSKHCDVFLWLNIIFQRAKLNALTTNVRKHHTTCISQTKFLSKMLRKIQHLLRNNTTNSLLFTDITFFRAVTAATSQLKILTLFLQIPQQNSIETLQNTIVYSIEYYSILYSVG